MSTWKTYKLGKDVVTKLGDGLHGTPVYDDNGEYYFINGSNLVEGKIVVNSNTKKVSEEEYIKYKKDLSDKTILLGINGTIGNVAIYNNEKCILGKSAAYFNINDNFDKQFIRYVLTNEHFQNYIKNNASGTTIKNVGLGLLREYEFSAPEDIATQTQIAQILSSLDDKIELNLQMNQTLEAMAQALFKEWFVDFNFPGFDGELVDGLPKGWRIGSINDIANVIDCLHSKKPEPVKEKTGNIYLQLNNILDNGLLDLSKIFWITDEDYKKWISRIEISQGDCVITNVGRVGAVARIPKGVKGALGRNMTGIRLKNNYQFPGFLITLLKSELIRSEIEQKKDVGTILEALNVKNIPKLSFPLPPIEILIKFEFISSVIWEKLEENNSQNLTLTQTRDALLPKLMSGKIKI